MQTKPSQPPAPTTRTHATASLLAWGGTTLLAIGLLVIALNLADVLTARWWAMFILLPGVALAYAATMARKLSGALTLLVRLTASVSAILLTVASMFLLGLNWATWWPLMLLVTGAATAWVGIEPRNMAQQPNLSGLASLLRWTGTTMALLSFVFLANGTTMADLGRVSDQIAWWSAFILMPALGAGLSARQAYRHNHATTAAWLSLISAALVISAVLQLLSLSWTFSLMGILLIASGALFVLIGLRR